MLQEIDACLITPLTFFWHLLIISTEIKKRRQLSLKFNSVLLGNHEKNVAKKVYTETHFVSLIPYVKQSMDNGVNEAMFGDWLISFFKTENNSDVYTKYNEACSGGVARTASIMARHEALGESYMDFFKEENSKNILTTV